MVGIFDPFNDFIQNFRGHRGNELIKRAGVKIEWTPAMIIEYAKCSEDPIYFAEKYMKIIVKGKGLQPILLYPYQREMISALKNNRFNIFATARQAGKSTVVCAFVLWYLIFNENKPLVAFLANKGETAVEILGKVKLAYENIPSWLQHGVMKWNESSIELENGSRAIAKATSSDSIRGFSIDLLFVDEAAFVENWDKFWPSTYNTLSSSDSTKAVLVSTPNGLNHFWETWELANKFDENGERKSEFQPIKVTWQQVPGRDEKWYKTTLRALNYDTQKFDQEHSVSFLGSSGTLIGGWKLEQLSPEIPVFEQEEIKQYAKPVTGKQYVLVADVSEGKGLDYSAFNVIDVSSQPFRQVCTYRSNLLTPIEYADVIHNIAKQYNNASVLVELNSIGAQVCSILHYDYEYPNMIHTESAGPAGKKVSSGFSSKQFEIGVRTTKTVKAAGCSLMKMLIEQNKLIVIDANNIYELSRFSKKGKSYEAETGATDDLVMTLVLFSWLTDQVYFKELTDINVLNQLRDRSEKQVMDQLVPFGSFSDGTESNNSAELLGKNEEGWVLDNTDPKVRIYF